jgi:predicted RNA binding protein YcfA (HicA-like mRNA interferase family)
VPKQPVVKVRKLVRSLKLLGYHIERQSGSHIFLKRPGDGSIIIPRHGDNQIPTGTLHTIINDISTQNGLSRDEIMKMLEDL